MSYKLGSLFDGSGGFPLSGALCGIEPTWAAEVEPYPIAVTRSRFPGMKHLGDISKVNGADIEPVDIITFGSPCQDLSVAGKRAGLKHEANGDEETTRSGLFMEAVRIIKEMRAATNGVYPRFALWENVPGAFSSNKGEDFRIVCEELIKVVEPSATMPAVPQKGWAYSDSYIGDGWSLAYRVFDAQYWGVPQRRRRIHLIVDFRGTSAREILFEREGLRGYFATGRTPWQATASHAQDCTGADDCQGETAGAGGGRQLDAVGLDLYNTVETGDKAATLTTQGGGTASGPSVAVPYTLKVRSGCDVDATGKSAGKGALIQVDKSATLACVQDQYLFQPVIDSHILDDQGGSVMNVRTDGKAPTLRAQMGGHPPVVMEPICMATQQGGAEIRTDDKAPTLTAAAGMSGNNQPVVSYGFDQGATRDVGKLFIEEASKTLTNGSCPGHHNGVVVAYGLDRASFNQGQNAQFGFSVDENISPTIIAKGPGGVAYTLDEKMGQTYVWEDQANTLAARDYKQPQAVCFQSYQNVTGPLMANSHPGSYTGQDAFSDMLVAGVDCRNATETPELNGTMQAKPNGGFSFNCNQIVRVQYIVRRLTPTECARLQGFADWWGHLEQKTDLTDEEHSFWMDVRNTHAAINGKAVKDYTKAQMLTWYNKLWTDAAEYKMWGNGIALPPALYCMQGITDVLNREEDDAWML